MNVFWSWLSWPLKPLQGPVADSPKGKLSWADWLASVRVQVYTVVAVTADHALSWLSGIHAQSLWLMLAIGLAMGVAELLRRLDKDYTRPTPLGQPPAIEVPSTTTDPVDAWMNQHGNKP